MSQSQSGPSFGDEIYFYFVQKRVKGKLKNVKIRVRISEKIGEIYHLQRVRDGYTSQTRDISNLILEE